MSGVQRTGVLVIGAGFGGIGTGIRLRREGREDFLILEREPEVGGTWFVNTYPGCACDVQSHLYSFSFEPNPEWSRTFSPQQDIWRYLRHCVDKYGLRPHLRLSREVVSARFDAQRALWCVSTRCGERYEARVLVSAIGPLDRPAWPDIPGLSEFAGPVFHSQRWRHDVDLSGKRVAVIGTGASAIQFVPAIAPQVAQLTVFQRTAPWVLPKPDRPLREYERALLRRFPSLQRAWRWLIYWTLEARAIGFVRWPGMLRLAEFLGRRHIRKHIRDPELVRKLMPDFRLGCKRVLLSNDWYPALARPNVSVETAGIARVAPDGLVTRDGRHIAADVIILGTGFAVSDPVPQGMVTGLDGRDLATVWGGAPEAYRGIAVAGFPNLFLLNGPNTGLGHSSVVFTIESQLNYLQRALEHMDRHRIAWMAPREDAQRRWNEWLQRRMARTVWQRGGCRSWYQNPAGRNVALWPGFTIGYRMLMRRFDPADFEVCAAG